MMSPANRPRAYLNNTVIEAATNCCPTVLLTLTALPHWTASLDCCMRKVNSCSSAVTNAMQLLSHRASPQRAKSPRAPTVSTSTGTNSYNGDSNKYFCHFFSSASLTTVPQPTSARLMSLNVNVSGHMKSHTRQRPRVHGTTVSPSGCSPQVWLRDDTSNIAGISTEARQSCGDNDSWQTYGKRDHVYQMYLLAHYIHVCA